MPDKNRGKGFEILTESIYQKLKTNPTYEKVTHNVFLDGADGKRQVDVLITGSIAGIDLKIVVECKDHKNRVAVGMIDAFHSKLLDLKASKGILISKKGFSSKSISKAKRLGITLCTAHEVLSGKWEPEIDMNVLIEELKPISFDFKGDVRFFKGASKFAIHGFSKGKFPKVNGIDLIKLVAKKWKNGTLKYKNVIGLQEIQIEELVQPYIVNSEEGDSIGEITDLKVFFDLQIRHFETSLKKLKGSQILNNVTEGIMNLFIEIPTLESLNDQLKPVKISKDKFYNGFIFSVRVTPKINVTPHDYEFKLKGN